MAGKMESVEMKNISPENAKKIIGMIDENSVSLEEIIGFINIRKEAQNKMINQNNDKEKFNAEEIKVNKYLEDHKGENISYRDAVLATLDRSEKPVESQKQKEEFAEYAEGQRKDLLAVDEYLEKHPNCSYRDAVKIVLCKDNLSEPEILVEEYMESHEGCDYKTAVLAVLDTSGKPKREK